MKIDIKPSPRPWSLLIAAGTLVSVAGCGYFEAALDPEAALYDTVEERIGVYVSGCVNGTHQSMLNYAERYFERVPADGAPTEGQPMDAPYRNESCDQAIEAAEDSTAPVDVAAREFQSSLDTVQPMIDEVERYYGREMYLDDDFARGIELHGEIVPTLEAFFAASDTFTSAVSEANDDLLGDVVGEADDADADMVTLLQASMQLAEDVMDALSNDEGLVLESTQYEQVDPQAFADALAELDEMWDRTLSRAAETDEDDQFRSFGSIEHDMEGFIRAAVELDRRFGQPTMFTEEEVEELIENPDMADFGFEDLLGKYNGLVSTYNIHA